MVDEKMMVLATALTTILPFSLFAYYEWKGMAEYAVAFLIVLIGSSILSIWMWATARSNKPTSGSKNPS
ncbi:MAG: hypothetical protein F7C37_05915 [Desulfurococcales archaeon]|nr:hypothetical protein [Desulfurococcales archaeon]